MVLSIIEVTSVS